MNDQPIKDLLKIPDSILIAHALNSMANHTETGNVAVSLNDRMDAINRANRSGQPHDIVTPTPLCDHDVLYVKRLRAIANTFK